MTHSRIDNDWIEPRAARAQWQGEPERGERRRRPARGRGWWSALAGVLVGATVTGSAVATYAWLGGTFEKDVPRASASLEVARAQQWSELLARSVLTTLDDTNRSANYSVLHDLAAPAFQHANPPERLARIFAELRQRKVDLSIALRSVPHWHEPPRVDQAGILRLRGSYGEERLTADFALAFLNVAGEWRLAEVTVATRPKAD